MTIFNLLGNSFTNQPHTILYNIDLVDISVPVYGRVSRPIDICEKCCF